MGKRKFNNGMSAWDYVGNMTSMAGTGMSIGGPVGAGVGAVAGLGMSIMQAQKMKEAELAKYRQGVMLNNTNMSNMIRANYDMNGANNTGIPGFKKGKSTFNIGAPGMPNAYVSKGEVMADPMTGQMAKVPGEYNPSNPDTVMTNVSPDMSIFSADRKNSLPFGKSTPADIAIRMTKAGANADKVLAGKGSRLDKMTAELNKSNIDKQLANLDKLTYMQNSSSNNGNLPGFANGKPAFAMSRDKWANKTGLDPTQGISEVDIDEKYKQYLSDLSSTQDSIGRGISGLASIAPAISNLTQTAEVTDPIYTQYMNPMISYNLAPEMADISSQASISRYNQSISGGAGMQYGTAIYGQSLANRGKLFNTAQRFNAEQTLGYAGRFNQQAQDNTIERRRIQDVNMRNQAAARTAKSTGLSQLSQFTQTRQLGENQEARDQQALAAYIAANKGVIPKELLELIESTYNMKEGVK